MCHFEFLILMVYRRPTLLHLTTQFWTFDFYENGLRLRSLKSQ